MYRFIYSLCGNESLTEEVTQETFLKALTHIDTFQGNCQMKVWLCQIAKNTLYTYQTKEKKTRGWTDIDTALESKQTSLDQPLVKLLVQKEEALRIHKILHKMKEPYKEVFMLRIFGELNFAQISQLFNKSESWARVTFYRAKHLVQKKLEEEGRLD